jgi:hypothetical protein
VNKVLKGFLVCKVLKASREFRVLKALWAHKACKAPRVCKALLVKIAIALINTDHI